MVARRAFEETLAPGFLDGFDDSGGREVARDPATSCDDRGMRFAPVLICAGCFTGAPAERAVDVAWLGRTRAEIVDRWDAPAGQSRDGANEVLHWSFETTHVELPTGGAAIAVHRGPNGGSFDATAVFRPGAVWQTTTEAAALVDPGGLIARVEGASLHWGPPNDANLHWGTIFGIHAGMGRLDTTPTPLPSGNVYIGGMLGPTLGLVGTAALVAGTSDAGGAIALAGGVALQWWPVNRLWVRAGPAMMLTLDPGFNNAALRPGLTTGASYAFVKIGRFAVDVCLDVTVGTSSTFGSLGFGANLN